MDLVIKIPDETYQNIQKRSTEIQAKGDVLENAVLNGKLLDEKMVRVIENQMTIEKIVHDLSITSSTAQVMLLSDISRSLAVIADCQCTYLHECT